MPRGGHNRKPTALRVLQGTDRADRVPVNEPKPKPVAPAPLPWLDAAAKRVWRQQAPMLERLGVLTEGDGLGFAAYCEAVARYVAAVKRLRSVLKAVREFEADKAQPPIRQAEVSVERALHDVRQMGAEFGWTPGARSRLSVAPEGGGDEPDVLQRLWANRSG